MIKWLAPEQGAIDVQRLAHHRFQRKMPLDMLAGTLDVYCALLER